MTLENGEAQHYDKNETLGDMVSKKFNISRKKFKANNYERLAKMAHVPGKQETYSGTLEQNIRIRNRILKNDVLPLQEYVAVVKKFSLDQQKAIEIAFPDKKINTYLANISPTQLQKFIQLTPTQLVAFLDQETKKVQNKKEKISQKSAGSEINDATTEQVVSLNQLIHVEEKIDNFISKYGIKELERDKTTGIFIDKTTEQKFQSFSTQLTSEQKTQYEQLKTNKGEKVADTFVRTLYQTQLLQTPEIQSKLNDEAKYEFADIVQEFYVASKNLDVDMSSFGLEAMYQKAKTYIVERYITTDPYQKLSYNINSAPAVNAYFSNNTTTELVPENRKDKAYYLQLLRWYPALDTVHDGKKLSEYLPYINEDMTIKSEVADQQKKLLSSLLPQLEEQGKPYEKKLLGMTNSLTQTVAVEQCITTLQAYMDVNISEKENVMEQLKIAENRDAVSENLVVKINGTLNGKKIALSYNLLTGSVSYQSFMTKQTDTEQSPIIIGANSEESVPLITLPKFGDFVDASKTIDYKDAINSCSTQEAYTQKITDLLKASAQSHQDMDNEKDMLKKYILKDMITQNIFSLTGRTTEGLPHPLLITPSEYPQMHAFYNLISKSLTYYSMGSIDDLQLFQQNIQTLLTYATGPIKTQSTESILAEKAKNQEMFVIHSLLNQTNIPVVTSSLRDQHPEEKLLSLFRCFQKKTGALSIIDGEMMNDFFKASKEVSRPEKEETAVGKRKRGDSFSQLSHDIENTLDATDADDLLKNIT